jgi:hypothetical protein
MLCVERIAHCTCKLQRIEAATSQAHRSLREDLRRQGRAADASPGATLAETVLYDGDPTFERLVVYEQRLQNMIHRALNELRKLRKERAEVDALPPSPFAVKDPAGEENRDEQDNGSKDEQRPNAAMPLADEIERNEPTEPPEPPAPDDSEPNWKAITRDVRELARLSKNVRNEPTDDESDVPGGPSK